MTLREKQSVFCKNLALLILYTFRDVQATTGRRVELTMAEGYVGDSIDKPWEDTPHLKIGSHFRRLGQDLNLFVDGLYITGDHKVWRMLGAYWKSMDKSNRWGGDFSSRDFNHFSMEHEGIM